MPRQRTSVRARRKKLFTRTSSTFINNTPKPNSSILGLGKLLHSKSTYFYRWGSRKAKSDSRNSSSAHNSLASLQRHPVDLPKSNPLGRDSGPVQPGNDVLWRNCRQKNLSKLSSLSYVTPTVCTLALLVGGVITINPLVGSIKAFADEPLESTDNSVALSFIEGAASQQTPIEIGVVSYRSNIFQVSGVGISRYAIGINVATGDTGVLKGRSRPYITIDKVKTDTTVASFQNNTWGYAISEVNQTDTADSDLIYNPVPSGNDANNFVTLASRDRILDTSVSDQYKLVFAAKLGEGIPADHYEASLYLSVVADTSAVTTLGFTGSGKTITKMQEMTDEICRGATDTDVQHLLTDERDGKVYWVSKLKDGRCWMTQNLDFDLENRVLTPNDTNVTTAINTANITASKVPSVKSPYTIVRAVLSEWPSHAGNFNYKGYYDPGDYYYLGPADGPAHSVGKSCDTATVFGDCKEFSKLALDGHNLSSMHYHVGNYYSYSATTLGQMDGQTSGNATISICPKGWRLPASSRDSNNNPIGEFKTMLDAYGIASSLTSTIDGKKYAAYDSPLYFVYGGAPASGAMHYFGNHGFYQSSTPVPVHKDADYVYVLVITGSVDPASTGYGARSYGQFVRCINDPNI